jgi:copper chaperone
MITLKVEGMSCAHCQRAVKEALERQGAQNVQVDLQKGLATVEGGVNTDQLIAAVVEEGYQASVAN